MKVLKPLLTWLTLFIFGSAIIGQIRFDRFPAYEDLVLALIIPPMAGLVFFWLINQVYKVKISPEYIQCYTITGWFKRVSWERIESVHPQRMYGLKYLLVEVKDSSAVLTVPTFLNNMDSFKSNVTIYGGKNNLLALALTNET